MFEAKPLHCVRELDVDAEVVRVELQGVALAKRGVLLDVDGQRRDVAVDVETQATVKIWVGDERRLAVGEGNGPVNALDAALRKALVPVYPVLEDMRLVDFKVRILTPQEATAAITRVMIVTADAEGGRWSTVGISPNIIDAAFEALDDAITYKLFREQVQANVGRDVA